MGPVSTQLLSRPVSAQIPPLGRISAQTGWAQPKGLGLAQTQYIIILYIKQIKNPFQKFVIFLHIFLSILLNVSLYFYTIKI